MKLEDSFKTNNQLSKINYGIVQGRLIKSPNNQLQWFPQPYWESEFLIAGSLGFSYIELIAERRYNPNNPIWNKKGIEKIKEVVRLAGLTTPVFCNDYIIDNSLLELKNLKQNIKLIDRGSLVGCNKYILPLFERSEITSNNAKKFIDNIRVIADYCLEKKIELCLETLLPVNELLDFLDNINRPKVGIVFDTGNRIVFENNLRKDIKVLGDKITHMHIKDKNYLNQNVVLGTGKVNFQEVFIALAEIEYNGLYTFETNRGNNPSRTAIYNKQFITYFHSENFLK